MNDSKKARNIKQSTQNKLFGLSKTQCYKPNCKNKLITDDKKDILAKIAHIEAASPNGSRYNPNMTDDERRDFDNLILLCDEHHIEIDSHPNEFPTELLKEWKMLHEGTDGNLLFKHTLKEKYLNHFNTISLLNTNTPKPIDEIFINLSIIKDKENIKDNGKISERQIYDSSWEAIHAPKEPIEIKELINKAKKSLVYGKAGVGKTTLCKYIAYKWAKNEFYSEFEYVIYISLRKWNNEILKEEIRREYRSQYKNEINLDIENNPKILFLFDGYDELKHELKESFRTAINDSNLTHYIITTRPYGYQRNDFIVDEQFETIGFTDENVKEYIEIFFKNNSEKSKELKNFLQSNIGIKHIAYIPLMLEMICSLWQEQPFSDSLTMTELYSAVVESILKKHSAKKEDEAVYKRANRKKINNILGKLAFKGLTKQTILFNGDFIEEVIDDEDIEFFEKSVINSGFLKSDRQEKDMLDNKFGFIHLTFQEYFSALYVASLSKEVQSEIVRDWKFYPHMQVFFAFFGGLIEDKEFLLGEIESEPKDLVGFYEFLLILDCLSQISKQNLKEEKIQEIHSNILYWLNFTTIMANFFISDYKILLKKIDSIQHIISAYDDEIINIKLKIIRKDASDGYMIRGEEIMTPLSNNKILDNLIKIVRDNIYMDKGDEDSYSFLMQYVVDPIINHFVSSNLDNSKIYALWEELLPTPMKVSVRKYIIDYFISSNLNNSKLYTLLEELLPNPIIQVSIKKYIIDYFISSNLNTSEVHTLLITLLSKSTIELDVKEHIINYFVSLNNKSLIDKAKNNLQIIFSNKSIKSSEKIDIAKCLISLGETNNKLLVFFIEQSISSYDISNFLISLNNRKVINTLIKILNNKETDLNIKNKIILSFYSLKNSIFIKEAIDTCVSLLQRENVNLKIKRSIIIFFISNNYIRDDILNIFIEIFESKDCSYSNQKRIAEFLIFSNKKKEYIFKNFIDIIKNNNMYSGDREDAIKFLIKHKKNIDYNVVENKNISFHRKLEIIKIFIDSNKIEIIIKTLEALSRENHLSLENKISILRLFKISILKSLISLDVNKNEFIDIIINHILNKDFDPSIFNLDRVSDKSINILISTTQYRDEVIDILNHNKENERIIKIFTKIVYDKNCDSSVRIKVAKLVFKNYLREIDISKIGKKDFISTFIKESSLKDTFEAFGIEYMEILEKIIDNKSPLYWNKKNELCTIENGKEIITQREVVTLHNIKMRLKGAYLND